MMATITFTILLLISAPLLFLSLVCFTLSISSLLFLSALQDSIRFYCAQQCQIPLGLIANGNVNFQRMYYYQQCQLSYVFVAINTASLCSSKQSQCCLACVAICKAHFFQPVKLLAIRGSFCVLLQWMDDRFTVFLSICNATAMAKCLREVYSQQVLVGLIPSITHCSVAHIQ